MTNLFKTLVGAIAAVGIALGAGTYVIKNSGEPAVVYANPGGGIFEFMDAYGKILKNGTTFEVRGVCASACTFFLGILPKEQVCYTDRAYLGFHGVYSGGFLSPPSFNQPMTRWTYEYVYTPEVITKLEELGWSMERDLDPAEFPTGMLWQKSDFLEDLGYKKCDG